MHPYLRSCSLCGGDGGNDPREASSLLCFRCGRPISETASTTLPREQAEEAPVMSVVGSVASAVSESKSDQSAEGRAKNSASTRKAVTALRSVHGH